MKSYAARVRAYEKQGMSTSDAQGCADAEDMKAIRNQFFVYEGEILRAAQPTFYGALRYMKPGRIIVIEARKAKGPR